MTDSIISTDGRTLRPHRSGGYVVNFQTADLEGNQTDCSDLDLVCEVGDILSIELVADPADALGQLIKFTRANIEAIPELGSPFAVTIAGSQLDQPLWTGRVVPVDDE